MTGFHNVRFPDDISYGSRGGPVFSTSIVTALSGDEQRNINWSEARASYNVAYGVRTEAQLAALIAFFRARQGRGYGFRFKDWTDYQATDQVLGVGNDETVRFPLIKTYESGESTHRRTISQPILDTVSISLQGQPLVSGWQFEEGAIVFDVAPADGVEITVSFEFDVPVRFDTDELSISLDAYGIGSAKQVPLIEVRV